MPAYVRPWAFFFSIRSFGRPVILISSDLGGWYYLTITTLVASSALLVCNRRK